MLEIAPMVITGSNAMTGLRKITSSSTRISTIVAIPMMAMPFSPRSV